ncbi:MAG: type I-U CRISPR-associated protein Cas7 [Planctomycetota bacterium]|nr:MAG: type I-U CRISPR-associated protein Cas7 [Planctomycetota bacterium]
MSPACPTPKDLDAWISKDHVVALHYRQHLVPAEGRGAVFFPPTYANTEGGYQINELADGTKIADVDSVASQANRREPIFLREDLRHLVPQIAITHDRGKELPPGRVSLLEAGHRLGDAIVRCTELAERAQKAFRAQRDGNDARLLAKLAPTSLVFGAWDSRDTMTRIPRLLAATVRAWDVSVLKRSAQYVPALDYAELEVFSEAEKAKAEGKSSSPLAERGYVHVPAVGTHGGVIARGPIRLDLTVNLVQLRRLEGGDDTLALRRYILGLALVAAAEPIDPFFRQGCLLVPDDEVPAEWTLVLRDGRREAVDITPEWAREVATEAATAFGVGENLEVRFDKKKAKSDAKKKQSK